jgi:large subunit ribosomal protein L7/L12
MNPTTAGWIIGIAVVVIALVFLVATRRRDRDPLGSPARARLPVPPDVSLTPAELAELGEINARAGKINAIKRLREMRTISLADAKKVVDVLAAGGTLPVASPTTIASGGVSGAVTSPSSVGTLADRARLLRDEAGPIPAIKYVREQTGMSLAEAKRFVDALR